jgi:hypothetical protein
MLYDAISHYRFTMHVVTCPYQYTPLELVCFDEDGHNFMTLWSLLYGKEGCTNYTHLLTTYLIKYMRNFRCLHRYSQQGWEARNAVVTSFFFRQTQRGGHVYELESKSKLKPIARGVQRRYIYVSGITDGIFKREYKEKEKELQKKSAERMNRLQYWSPVREILISRVYIVQHGPHYNVNWHNAPG